MAKKGYQIPGTKDVKAFVYLGKDGNLLVEVVKLGVVAGLFIVPLKGGA